LTPGAGCAYTSPADHTAVTCTAAATAPVHRVEVSLGDGNDELAFGVGMASTAVRGAAITGGPGADRIAGTVLADRIDGGPGNDVLVGSARPNTIHGGGGKDRIRGLGGADDLYGGTGYDDIDGGTGRDTCHRGPGGARVANCEVISG